jgi:predicted methyltransferase MtxX (methanogen marker protein 4)
MTSAELTLESSFQVQPNAGLKMSMWKGTGTNATDYATLTEFTVVQGAIIFATDGTVGTFTITGTNNVITFTNAASGSKIWNILAWGY